MTPFAVLWDLDGTLVDTAELHFSAWAKLLGELGRPWTRADFSRTFGRRNPDIFALLFGPEFPADRAATLADLKESYYREASAAAGVEPLPGARQLVLALAEVGAAQAIASSAPRANVELLLRLTGLAPCFAACVGSEDTSQGKPHPEVFETAARRLGVPAHLCLVLEDALAGVQAAKAAGMACVAVTFVGHHSAEALRAAGADLVVPSLEHLSPAVVRRLLGLAG